MTDTVTIRGFIATAPTQKFLPNGNIPVTNFRIASTPRWFDATSSTWKEGTTNWYTVNSFRALAYNSARSLQVGQPVLVTGRLRVKQFERADGSPGTSIEVDATSIGHDLNYGLANFARVTDRKPEVDETDRKFNEQVAGEQKTNHGYESLPPLEETHQPGQTPTPDSTSSDQGLTETSETSEAAVALTS